MAHDPKTPNKDGWIEGLDYLEIGIGYGIDGHNQPQVVLGLHVGPGEGTAGPLREGDNATVYLVLTVKKARAVVLGLLSTLAAGGGGLPPDELSQALIDAMADIGITVLTKTRVYEDTKPPH